MRIEKLSIGSKVAIAILTMTIAMLTPSLWAAPQEKVLYSFGSHAGDGNNPTAGLVFDSAGNLYGTTYYGGTGACVGGCGTVFQLTPNAGGTWSEKVLYSFQHNGTDGTYPYAALTIDTAGNLYGTTSTGASHHAGTVFELTPNSGDWAFEVIHTFAGRNGRNPMAPMIFDAAGNLYGTTSGGGTSDSGTAGTVFELRPQADGTWKEKLLHSFQTTDGANPYAGVVFDAAGNLYGTTANGGKGDCAFGGCGTVFELTPKAGGRWTEKVLHYFGTDRTDGLTPSGGLIFDSGGDLYGTTTSGGGTHGGGTVFELVPTGSGGWTETLLHAFSSSGKEGDAPTGNLIFDGSGNLYGVTGYGGDLTGCNTAGCGAVFELTPQAGGGWMEKVPHIFGSGDGANPDAGLLFDASGNLFGTTVYGGTGGGIVFEVTP
jgi:uncharacterized repeat protein (TIGR03803 family)